MDAKQSIPTESIMCLALVKPRSDLARLWGLAKPGYCIYEYSKAFGSREIRWGDGSSQELTIEQHSDLVLLPDHGEVFIETLFNG